MEKLNLSSDIREISPEELEEVLDTIKKKAPKAYKEVDKENYQVVVDYLTRAVFEEIKE